MDLCEKIKSVSEYYKAGCTCSQAVLCAYAKELGLESEQAYRLMEGFGDGCGGAQEICGALVACIAIISFHCSNGKLGDENARAFTYSKINQVKERFIHEYGGITCREILHGETPKPLECGMKVKDSILIIEDVLKGVNSKKTIGRSS